MTRFETRWAPGIALATLTGYAALCRPLLGATVVVQWGFDGSPHSMPTLAFYVLMLVLWLVTWARLLWRPERLLVFYATFGALGGALVGLIDVNARAGSAPPRFAWSVLIISGVGALGFAAVPLIANEIRRGRAAPLDEP
jgi:hypothetical protein